jgi:flap endonuclease-1
LFGAPRLLRNITMSGRRKIPRKNSYIEVLPEEIRLENVLAELGISREQLIDIGILIGTDFNPDGVKGIGPKKALKLIKKKGSLEELMKERDKSPFPFDHNKIRQIFLNPRVTDQYRILRKTLNKEGIIRFLCDEKDFSQKRVTKTIKKIMVGQKEAEAKKTLEDWF